MASENDSDNESGSFDRFRKLVKRVISVPKPEIDKRAEKWKAAREAEKSEESEE